MSEHNSGILDGMVLVDMQIALGMHRKIECAVLAYLREHMVEKSHSRMDIGMAVAVKIDLDGDRGLGRGA